MARRLHIAGVVGAGIVVGIVFLALAGYMARLALRGHHRPDAQSGRQRPLRHRPPDTGSG